VERARFDKMLSSAEIGTLIAALGTGIGREEFDVAKTRYHKIIIMTDADVDGSHIRTLLLTFFYRQMPQVIEKGYLYIAQPPLYRIKRGNQRERYLKDDKALEDYLIGEGIEDVAFNPASDGMLIQGDPLKILVEQSRIARGPLETLSRKAGSLRVVEQTAIAGALDVAILSDDLRAAALATEIAARLNGLSDSDGLTGGGWQGEATPEALILSRTRRGVTHRHILDRDLLKSVEARTLNSLAASLKAHYDRTGRLTHKDKELRPITGPVALLDAIMELGRHGVTIQRYKGLGEMNPEQLWETTLDPTKRSLLQVKVNHADEAEEVFSTLMGDIVEPRREFIQENALKVANLDV
jgi:DNA gyrase subunit B